MRTDTRSYTAFLGETRLARGVLGDVLVAVKAGQEQDEGRPILVFDDESGRCVDVDLRGSDDEIRARVAPPPAEAATEPEVAELETTPGPGAPRGRGRPRLGVVAREVTLLPRHWEWLSRQRGGASGALRQLVDAARARDGDTTRIRRAQESTDRFMATMAGDRAGYEEAARALYAGNRERFTELVAAWPADIRRHTLDLAEDAFGGGQG